MSCEQVAVIDWSIHLPVFEAMVCTNTRPNRIGEMVKEIVDAIDRAYGKESATVVARHLVPLICEALTAEAT